MTQTASQTPAKHNLRHYARVPLKMQVTVSNQSDKQRQARIENISRAGIMIACDRECLETLMPPTNGTASSDSNELTLIMHLPLSEATQTKVSIRCRTIHIQRKSQDAYLIGLSYLATNNDGYTHIESFIRSRLLQA